jgi:hypothetical protein
MWRGSNQSNTQNERSLYHQRSIDFRCYLELARFEPRLGLHAFALASYMRQDASMAAWKAQGNRPSAIPRAYRQAIGETEGGAAALKAAMGLQSFLGAVSPPD